MTFSYFGFGGSPGTQPQEQASLLGLPPSLNTTSATMPSILPYSGPGAITQISLPNMYGGTNIAKAGNPSQQGGLRNPAAPLGYQPKYKVGTNLQRNTNWLSGLKNLSSLFNPEERARQLTSSLLTQEGSGVGDGFGLASPSTSNVDYGGWNSSFTPSVAASLGLAAAVMSGNVKASVAAQQAMQKEYDAWTSEQADNAANVDTGDLEQQAAEGGGVDSAPFGPGQQEADNPDGFAPFDGALGGGNEGGGPGTGGDGADGQGGNPGGGDNDGSDGEANGW